MNVKTVAIASTTVAAVMVAKKIRTLRANKREAADFEETVNSVNAMLQKLEGTDNIYVTLPA